MRQELESKLLFAAPAEMLLAEPASVETRRLVAGIGEQLAGAPRMEAVPSAPYRLASTALDAVQAFYGTRHGGTDPSGGGGGSSAAGQESSQHQEEGGGGEARAVALAAVRALPPLVLRALAHLLDYLRPFGLEAVLRLGAAFQPWDQVQEMRLSANTLRCGVVSGACCVEGLCGSGGERGTGGCKGVVARKSRMGRGRPSSHLPSPQPCNSHTFPPTPFIQPPGRLLAPHCALAGSLRSSGALTAARGAAWWA